MTTAEILTRARNAFKMGEYPLVETPGPAHPGSRARVGRGLQPPGQRVREDGPVPQGHRAVPEGRGDQARLRRGAQQPRGHPEEDRVLRRGHPPPGEGHRPRPRQRGDLYYNLGNVYKALGNTAQAEENFQKAIAVDSVVRALLHQPGNRAGGGRAGSAMPCASTRRACRSTRTSPGCTSTSAWSTSAGQAEGGARGIRDRRPA